MTSVGWDNNSGDEDDWEGRLFIKQLVLEAFSMLDVFQEIRNWNSELKMQHIFWFVKVIRAVDNR